MTKGEQDLLQRIRELEERLEKLRSQREERGRLLHQQFTIAVGTVGAIIFAGLVLLLEYPTPFEKPVPPPNLLHLSAISAFHGLVSVLGLLIILSVFSVIATSFVGAGLVSYDSWLGWFGYSAGAATIVGLALVVIAVIGDVSPTGSNVLFWAFVVLAVFFSVALGYGLSRQRPSA